MANKIDIRVGLDTKQADTELRRFTTGFKSAIDSNTSSVGQLRTALSGLRTIIGAIGISALAVSLKQLSDAALQSAINLDKTRQTLIALTGSVDAANKKIAELRKLSATSPGVTTSFATELFAQLKALNELAEPTINKLIQAIGRLNAVFTIPDARVFAQNLTQIFKGGFEISDIKEARQAVPIFDQILRQAFGTGDPEALRKLQKAGKLTLEAFLGGIADAIAKDPRFANIQESIGAKLAKAKDNILVAIAPLGEELAKILLPALKGIEVAIDALFEAFKSDFGGIRQTVAEVTDFLGARFRDAVRVFEDNREAINALRKEFARLSEEVKPIVESIGEVLKNVFSNAFRGALVAAQTFTIVLTNLLRNILNGIEVVRSTLSRVAEGAAFIAGAGLGPGGGEAAASAVRSALGPSSGATLGVDIGDVITSADFARLDAALAARKAAADKTGGGGAGSTKKSELQKAIDETKQLAELVKALKANEGKLFEEEFKQLQLKFEQDELIKQLKNRAVRAVLTAQGKPLPADLPKGIGLPRGISLAGLGGQDIGGLPGGITAVADTAESLDASRTRFATAQQNLRIQEVQIRNQVTAGILSEAEAQRALNAVRSVARDELIKTLEAQRQHVDVGELERLQITEQIEQLKLLGVELSDTTRFMVGFNSQIETSGDAFDRFGQNVSRAFTNIKDVFNGLKNAVLQFFNDIVGQGLQNLMRQVLGPIFGGGGGGFGNLFRAPGGFAQAFAGGGGLAAPPSVSSGLSSLFGGGRSAGGGLGGLSLDPLTAKQLGGGGGVGSFFGGIGKSFAATAPLLGLSLGIGLGGQSTAGKIFGGIGGALAGSAKGLIGLGSALGIAGLVAAPFFLLGSFFLGKAKQRGKDEEAAGQMLLQAQEQIRQLKAGIANDSIDGSQARAIFESEILTNFRNQIGTLKTGSVKRSRLSNQVADLRKFFDNLVLPEITAQAERRRIAASNALTHSKLIPEFNTGGMARGGLAVLHPGEMVLNQLQQHAVIRQSSPQVFDRAGVPGVQQNAQFPHGGIMPAGSSQHSGDIVIEKLIVGISAEDVFVAGGSGAKGRRVIVKQTEVAMRKGEL